VPGLVATVLEEFSTIHPVLGRLSRLLRRWESIVSRK
jgi:hypothetical protein